MPMRAIVVLAALSLVVSAAPAAAQITAKEAVKQSKAAAKVHLGTFKSTVNDAQVVVLARVAAFDATVPSGGFTIPAVQTLAQDLQAFQTAVQEGLFRIAADTSSDGKAALEALAGGGVTLDEIPLALANLPGGLPDQVRTAVGKLLAKTYKTLNKRLAKTSALVGKGGDATFFAVLDPPPRLPFAFSHLGGSFLLFDLTIDLRMSARTATGESHLWVGGTTLIDGIALLVSAIPLDSPFTDEVVVMSEGRGRFFTRLGGPLSRTNYLLRVVPSGGEPRASAASSFAIR